MDPAFFDIRPRRSLGFDEHTSSSELLTWIGQTTAQRRSWGLSRSVAGLCSASACSPRGRPASSPRSLITESVDAIELHSSPLRAPFLVIGSSDRSGRRDSSDELEALLPNSDVDFHMAFEGPEARVSSLRLAVLACHGRARGGCAGRTRRVGGLVEWAQDSDFFRLLRARSMTELLSLDRIGPANPSELPRWCKQVGAQREAEPPQRPQRRRTLRPGPPGESTVPEGGQPWPDWVAKA